MLSVKCFWFGRSIVNGLVHLLPLTCRTRCSGSPRCSCWRVSWPSSWDSFPSCLTKPLRHHPEKSRRLRLPCATRSAWRRNKKYIVLLSRCDRSGSSPLVCVCQSVPVLDVCGLLSKSVRKKRTILTVPWLVEFLSMLDSIGPLLICYRTALGTLLLLYKYVCAFRRGNNLAQEQESLQKSVKMQHKLFFPVLRPWYVNFECYCLCRRMLLGRIGEMCYLNKLLMLSVLGWLFQVKQTTSVFCFFFQSKEIHIPVACLNPFVMNFRRSL